MPNRAILSVLRLLLAILVLTAIGWQLTIHVGLGFEIVNFFSFFTNLANLFAAGVLLLSAVRTQDRRGASMPSDQVRAISTVNMAIVGIVFTILLRNEELGSLRPWINFVLHDLMPCAVVLDWLLDPPLTRMGARHLLRCLVFPALYLVYALIRGSQTGWYPYPFLNPARTGGYIGVAAYAAGITATFVIVGWLLLALGNRLRDSRVRSPS